jgi:hypothetical protein
LIVASSTVLQALNALGRFLGIEQEIQKGSLAHTRSAEQQNCVVILLVVGSIHKNLADDVKC